MTAHEEELAVLRATRALSPVQVEAMEQEIAELKQEHGVLSGQLHEIRAVLDEYVWPDDLDALHAVRRRIRTILDGAPPVPGPGCYPPVDGWDGVAVPASETEWGCRDRHGQVHSVGVENEAQARAMRSMTPVRREVGPWTEVQS